MNMWANLRHVIGLLLPSTSGNYLWSVIIIVIASQFDFRAPVCLFVRLGLAWLGSPRLGSKGPPEGELRKNQNLSVTAGERAERPFVLLLIIDLKFQVVN